MPDKEAQKDISPWEAMGLVWDIVWTVVILTMVFAFGGVYLDKLAGTKFVFTVIGFILLILVGKVILLKKAKKITDRLNAKLESTKKS
jgi:F0F1-type ATP synthase assembly protein I